MNVSFSIAWHLKRYKTIESGIQMVNDTKKKWLEIRELLLEADSKMRRVCAFCVEFQDKDKINGKVSCGKCPLHPTICGVKNDLIIGDVGTAIGGILTARAHASVIIAALKEVMDFLEEDSFPEIIEKDVLSKIKIGE